MLNFILFMLMIYHYLPFTSKLLSIVSQLCTLLEFSTKQLSSYSTTLLLVSCLLTSSKSLTFYCILHSTSILFCYFFSPIFLSGNTFYSDILCSIFCSRFSCIASCFSLTSHIHIPQLHIHIMDSYSQTDHELVILYAVSKCNNTNVLESVDLF